MSPAVSPRRMRLTLAAMTLSASMILVDQTAVPLATPEVIQDLNGSVADGQWILTANILPLAALMVFGGRLGDLLGLRRVFLVGACVFAVATALAGGAQTMEWMIAARVVQGVGAALMMPTALAIVSAVYPNEQRGSALGILAGASAFFAAMGPVLGGLLTAIDWRLVFLINVPLALVTIGITLRATPGLEPNPDAERKIDYPGVLSFGVGIAAIVFGLSQGPAEGFGSALVIGPLLLGALALAAFGVIETRVENPMIEFRLFRHLNFLAANISQFLAGMIELGLGFLLPFYLLLVVGIPPAAAGLALIPATLPIILAGPWAGKTFDRVGGRMPLAVGFGVLAASGIALSIAASDAKVVSLIPGLVLQGIGLGLVLTTNDPTGLDSVPEDDQGVAAGMINTAEQLGGAVGIAALVAFEYGRYINLVKDKLADQGITYTPGQFEHYKEVVIQGEQKGLNAERTNSNVDKILDVTIHAHIEVFQLVFLLTATIAFLGMVSSLVLVRKSDRVSTRQVFGRRSRWILSNAGTTPGLTRHPPPPEDDSGDSADSTPRDRGG